jgi:hypothetical protein
MGLDDDDDDDDDDDNMCLPAKYVTVTDFSVNIIIATLYRSLVWEKFMYIYLFI